MILYAYAERFKPPSKIEWTGCKARDEPSWYGPFVTYLNRCTGAFPLQKKKFSLGGGNGTDEIFDASQVRRRKMATTSTCKSIARRTSGCQWIRGMTRKGRRREKKVSVLAHGVIPCADLDLSRAQSSVCARKSRWTIVPFPSLTHWARTKNSGHRSFSSITGTMCCIGQRSRNPYRTLGAATAGSFSPGCCKLWAETGSKGHLLRSMASEE